MISKLFREQINTTGIFFLFVSIINAVFSVLVFLFFGNAIDSLTLGKWDGFLHQLFLLIGLSIALFFTDLARIFLENRYSIYLQLFLRNKVAGYLIDTENPYRIEAESGVGSFLPWFLDEVNRMSSVIFSFFNIIVSFIRLIVLFLLLGSMNVYLLLIIIFLLAIYFLVPLSLNRPIEKIRQESLSLLREEHGKSLNVFKCISIFIRNLRGEFFTKNLLKITKFFKRKNYKLMTKQHLINGFINFVFSIIILILELVNGILVFYSYLPFSSFVVVTAFFGMAISDLHNIKDDWSNALGNRFLFKRFYQQKEGICNGILPNFESIVISDLTYSFEGRSILKKLNIKINRGEKFAIIGPSGVGKTTLVNTICGFLSDFKGSITWNEVEYKNFTAKDIATRVYLLTDKIQIFNATVAENVSLFDKNLKEERIKEVLKIVGLDNFKPEEPVSEQILSKGEGQRLALARALIFSRDVLILDEALNGVHKKERERIESYLLSKEDLTIINVTHHLSNPDIYTKVIKMEVKT